MADSAAEKSSAAGPAFVPDRLSASLMAAVGLAIGFARGFLGGSPQNSPASPTAASFADCLQSADEAARPGHPCMAVTTENSNAFKSPLRFAPGERQQQSALASWRRLRTSLVADVDGHSIASQTSVRATGFARPPRCHPIAAASFVINGPIRFSYCQPLKTAKGSELHIKG
jgi:hypothetical protein